MKRIHILLMLAALILSATSCKKYLDVNPSKGKIIPNDVKQFRGLLDYFYMSDYTDYQAVMMTDDIALDAARTNNYNVNAVNAFRYTPDLYWARDIWIKAYKRINTLNTVIDFVMDASKGSQQEKEEVLAIAYVLRGFEYYELVNLFCKTYEAGKPNDAMGVPLVLKSDINQPLGTRETVQKVYDQLLKDILSNIDRIPPTSAALMEINKQGAYGMLARIYLQMQNYPKAQEMAEKALSISKPVIDYNTFKLKTAGNYYSGFVTWPEFTLWPDAIYIRKYGTPYALGKSYFYMSADLDAMFAANDLRRTVHFFNKESGGKAFPMGWQLAPNLSNQGFRNTGIGTPELQLIIAETAIRMSSAPEAISKALKQLNDLRRLRFPAAGYTDLSSTNATEVLQWTLDERRRELFMTPTRIYDIKRLNLEPAFRKNIVHKLGTDTYTIPPDSKLLLPLLPLEALYNSGIKQNER